MGLTKIHLFHSSARVKLQVALVVSLFLILATGVEARETYVQFASRILTHPPEGAEIRPDLEAAILRATNDVRETKEYTPLRAASKKLSVAARAHAMDLLMMSGMGHRASTGHDFESRMRAFHEGRMVLAPLAENAARLRNSKLSDTAVVQALVKQWMTSSGHRKNIVNRTFTSVAIGVVKHGDDVYAVQIFSGPQVKSNMSGASTE